MKLRETIAYNKDLITGWEKVIKKFKDSDAPMINTMTVSLFDKKGEKVYEAKAENVVNNAVAKMAYMDYFYSRIKGAIGTTAYAYPPWQVIVLTDYSGAEDADQPGIRGSLIGWADKTTAYSGTDNMRGTINLSETTLDTSFNGTLHFVFDFPTNAANGTFQTVWWAYSKSMPLFGILGTSGALSGQAGIRTIFSGGLIDSSATISAGGSLNKYTFDLVSNGTIAPTGMPAIAASGAEYDGSNVWIIDYAALKLHKFSGDMTQWISFVSITGWNSATWGAGILDITELNGVIYALSKNYYIVAIDKTTGACGTATDIRARCGLSGSFSDTYGGLTSNGSNKFYVFNATNTLMYILDSSLTYILTSSGIFLAGGYSPSGWSRATFDRSLGELYSASYYSNYYNTYKLLTLSIAPGAQNLLASPITKTATNTMKIQYDFQIQKVL